jgi:hypothetical protein
MYPDECARAVGDSQGCGLGDGVSLSILDDFRGFWAVGGVRSGHNGFNSYVGAICRPCTPSAGVGNGTGGKSQNSSCVLHVDGDESGNASVKSVVVERKTG